MNGGRPGAQRVAGTVLLVAGYSLAVWAALRIVPAFRRRDARRVAIFEAGTACVAAGWLLRGRWEPATANAGALAGVGLLWAILGRRRRR